MQRHGNGSPSNSAGKTVVTGNDTPSNSSNGSAHHNEDANSAHSASRLEDDDSLEDEPDYPEGGLQAWLTVFGAWCGMTGGLGLLNSVASLQNYIANHQLADYSESAVSWIFSIQIFIVFFCGIQIGPAFDAYGPRVLVLVGSIFLVVALMVLGECTRYWHFILDYAILSGLGSSLLVTPPLASIGHFFKRRRAFATGLAMTGPALGGVIFPLVFRAAYPQLGFAWACRILAFIMLFLLIFANLFLRSRLPRSKPTAKDILPDFKIYLDGDGALALCAAGLFLMELGLFIPLAYITSFCISSGVDAAFSYQILSILNAASVIGRGAPGFVADKLGRYNTMSVMLALCSLTNLAIWLPVSLITPSSQTTKAIMILYVVVFGLVSGTNLSLLGPCIGQLCETRQYGRYFATVYVFVAFAGLIGIPIAGNLVDAVGGEYWALIIFVGACYAGSAVCIGAVRFVRGGKALRVVF